MDQIINYSNKQRRLYIIPEPISNMNYMVLPLIGITMFLGINSPMTTIDAPSNNISFANEVPKSQPISMYDCSEGSNGCYGSPYCDINDRGSCYDRYEGNDDGSSTDPQSSSYKSINDPNFQLYN